MGVTLKLAGQVGGCEGLLLHCLFLLSFLHLLNPLYLACSEFSCFAAG